MIVGDKTLLTKMTVMPRAIMTGIDPDIREALEPMRRQTSLNALAHRQDHNPPGGHLDQGVVTRKIRGTTTRREFWVSFTRRARYLAHLVEFGTAPHYQPLRRRMHPGARPFPFFSPAFEATKNIVVNRVAAHVRRRVLAAARRG